MYILHEAAKFYLYSYVYNNGQQIVSTIGNYLMANSNTTLGKSLDQKALVIATLFPNGEIHNLAQKFITIENQGGIDIATESKIQKCAIQKNLSPSNLESIYHCMNVSLNQNSTMQKLVDFLNCYPTNTSNVIPVLEEALILGECLAN